ncbi:MAG: hypothetical protein AAF711_09290 [Planctomycetota bacterium]
MAKQLQPTAEPAPSREAEAPPSPTKVERVTKTAAPKPRHDVSLAWLVLVGLMILAALPLLIDLNTPGIWSEQEAMSVAMSSETAQRKTPIAEGETSLQSWTPVYRGESRWDLPPGGTWLHMVMYTGVPREAQGTDEPAEQLWVGRARLGSVIMSLFFVAAVFWAGYSLGGLPTGTISALVAMTMPLIIGFGRHANPQIVAAAWSALSIAGALWAMRPLRAAPSLVRQLIGWVTCGVGLGLATLTMGPSIIPGTLLCTIVLAMICPRRIGHIMGLLASTALAALLLTPWALHVHGQDADVWQQWLARLSPDFGQTGFGELLRRAGWRLSLAALVSGFWVIWLIPALIQPFSTSTGSARRRLMLGWGWLVTSMLLIMFAPGETRLSAFLLAIAPASVAIGLITQQYHDLSSEGRHARLWIIAKWLSCGCMLLLAIALPLLGYLLNHRADWVRWLPTMENPLLASMHWSFYAGAAAALLLAAVLATRFAIHHHPGRTTACLAIWLLIAFGLAAIPISRGDQLNTLYEAPLPEQISRIY